MVETEDSECNMPSGIYKRIKLMSEKTKQKIGLANSISLKGHTAWNKGKKCPQLSGEKNPAWKGGFPDCKDCGKKLTVYNNESGICIKCYGKYKRGANNPSWKGGITPITKLVRHSFKYRQWRDDVFTRDDFTCQWCLIRGGVELNADHIKSFAVIWEENNITNYEEAMNCEELWNINNGRTLCQKCHSTTDTYGRPSKTKIRI